jgi:hypothetical protein
LFKETTAMNSEGSAFSQNLPLVLSFSALFKIKDANSLLLKTIRSIPGVGKIEFAFCCGY